MKDLKPTNLEKMFWPLLFFLLSMGAAFLEYVFAQLATQIEITRTDNQIEEMNASLDDGINKWNILSQISVGISFILMVTGMVLLLYFYT